MKTAIIGQDQVMQRLLLTLLCNGNCLLEGLPGPHKINRLSISDRSKTQLDADGSLTISIQADSPGTAQEAHWLPTPASGPYKLSLRFYGPDEKMLKGEWSPPAVKKAG
jgi:hypothetical protein